MVSNNAFEVLILNFGTWKAFIQCLDSVSHCKPAISFWFISLVTMSVMLDYFVEYHVSVKNGILEIVKNISFSEFHTVILF